MTASLAAQAQARSGTLTHARRLSREVARGCIFARSVRHITRCRSMALSCLSRSFLLFPKAFQVPLGAFLDRTHLLALRALLDYGLRPLGAFLD